MKGGKAKGEKIKGRRVRGRKKGKEAEFLDERRSRGKRKTVNGSGK